MTKTPTTVTATTVLVENSHTVLWEDKYIKHGIFFYALTSEQETFRVCSLRHFKLLLMAMQKRGGGGRAADWRDWKGRAYSQLPLVCLPRKCPLTRPTGNLVALRIQCCNKENRILNCMVKTFGKTYLSKLDKLIPSVSNWLLAGRAAGTHWKKRYQKFSCKMPFRLLL